MHRSSLSPYEEERLVAQCIGGHDSAWQTMFRLYHPQLVLIIKAMMHGEGSIEEAEEIAAAVWLRLCEGAYSRLRRYDPRAGRLLGYLANVAQQEARSAKRSNRNRHARECSAAREEGTWDDTGPGIVVQEFLATLTKRERDFCLCDLLKQTKPSPISAVSSANRWQLRSRVLKKFRTYFHQRN